MQIRQPTTRAKELMKQGFIKGYVEQWGGTEEHAEQRFNEIMKQTSKKDIEYHRKTVEKYKDKERNESEEAHYQHALLKIKEYETKLL